MSGRASAAVDIKAPAPMVAASATAIFNDINLSAFASSRPLGLKFECKTRKKGGFCRRLAHALLTARVNQEVAASPAPGVRHGQKRKCWKQSKCPENNTRRKTAATGGLPLTIA
jgi:hypothetical protein